MANIPTFAELYTSVISDLEAEFGGEIPVSKSYLRVRAAVQAGRLKIFYLQLGKVQKNVFVDTAEPQAAGGTLERFGQVKLGRPPFPATSSEYLVQFTGADGETVPAFLPIKADDNSAAPGYLFQLDSPYTLAAPQQATIRALTPGIESRLVAGNTLTITSPIPLVDQTVTVISETVIPQGAEDLEEYREKTEEAFRLEPQGGAAADYRLWAADAQGVEQSYPYAASGQPNFVNLFVEATVADSTDGKGTPTLAILEAVRVAIEEPTATRPSRKPVTDFVNYLPITPIDVDVTIDSYQGLTPEKQSLIEAEITNVINSIRPFVSAIDVLADKNDTLDENRIINAIFEAAPGSDFGAITLQVNASTVFSFTFENGDIPHVNSITFTP